MAITSLEEASSVVVIRMATQLAMVIKPLVVEPSVELVMDFEQLLELVQPQLLSLVLLLLVVQDSLKSGILLQLSLCRVKVCERFFSHSLFLIDQRKWSILRQFHWKKCFHRIE